MTQRKKLTGELAAIMHCHVTKVRGRLTTVSRDCHISRNELSKEGIAKMGLDRLSRIFYSLKMVCSDTEFKEMEKEIDDVISKFADDCDYDLLDEPYE